MELETGRNRITWEAAAHRAESRVDHENIVADSFIVTKPCQRKIKANIESAVLPMKAIPVINESLPIWSSTKRHR